MMLSPDDAKSRVDELRRMNTDAVDLAHLVSLTARAEPELIRRLRLVVLPSATAAAEADLWFSGVAGPSSTSWLLLVPEVAELLREACAERFDVQRLATARDAIQWAHANASPLVRIEDDLHWHTMRGESEKIEEKLSAILEALRSPNAAAVARWTLRVFPRLSKSVRERPVAWLARFIAGQQLGQSARLEPGMSEVPPEVWPYVRSTLASTTVWARLVEEGVELSRQPLLGAQQFSVPLTEPVVIELPGRSERAVVRAEGVVRLSSPRDRVQMRTIDGTTYILQATESTPRETVALRWTLLANSYAEWNELIAPADAPVDIVFVAGDVTRSAESRQFAVAHEQLQSFVQRYGHAQTAILTVPGNQDGGHESPDLHNYVEFNQRIARPPYARRGSQPGDFMARLDLQGVRIGVVGLNTFGSAPRLAWSQIESLCGTDPEAWSHGYHFTILLTHYSLSRIRSMASPTLERIARLFTVQMSANEVSAIARADTNQSVLLRTDARRRQFTMVSGTIDVGEQRALLTGSLAERKRGNTGRRSAQPESSRIELPVTNLVPSRHVAVPEKWILIAGIAKASERIASIAREVGAALAATGYGLLTGGWPGVDEEATLGFAAAQLAAPDELRSIIHHYIGRIAPGTTVPGRRLFYASDRDAVEESVAAANAVVLISGLGGTEWIAEEAIRQQRPVIPIVATGGAARRIATLQKLDVPSLENEARSPVELAGSVVEELHRLSAIKLIRSAFENRIPIEGRVTNWNDGFFDVSIHGIRAVCSRSQSGLGRGEKPDTLVGLRFQFRITEVSPDGRRIVVSRVSAVAAKPSQRGALPRILVLDDSEVWLDQIQEVLEADFELTRTTDSVDAYRLADELPFDLVIVDMRLGIEVTGLEVINRIRRSNPNLRAIILSDYPDFSAIASRRADANTYVSKDNLATLPAVVRNVLLEGGRAARVFLSYDRADRERVVELYDTLIAYGYQPWLDLKSIQPGKRWETEINEAIDKCDFFVACLSRRSMQKEGMILKELKQALERQNGMPDGRVFIIPVRLEPSEVTGPLQRFQWVDLFEPQGMRALLRALSSQASANRSKDEIFALVRQGEGPTLEFKSTLRWDLKKERLNRALENVVLKTVAAFLNSETGGVLLLGVDDTGIPIGLQHEYATLRMKTRDGFEALLYKLLLDAYGRDMSPFLQIDFASLEGADVCRVTARPAPRPVYISAEPDRLYVRMGNVTVPLSTREALDYLNVRWKKG